MTAGPVNATPVWVGIPEPVVTHDTSTPDYPVQLVMGVPPQEFGFTPEEALDLAVRLMEVANDARGVPRG
jgi:hypothetical protein